MSEVSGTAGEQFVLGLPLREELGQELAPWVPWDLSRSGQHIREGDRTFQPSRGAQTHRISNWKGLRNLVETSQFLAWAQGD